MLVQGGALTKGGFMSKEESGQGVWKETKTERPKEGKKERKKED